MAYVATTHRIGLQPIADTSTTQKHELGLVVSATDPTYGEGEFIYLLGVVNTVVGLMVTYNATTYQTALTPDTANLGVPVAVAMSANVAAQYGWYQIRGLAVIKKTARLVTAQVALFQSATAGRVRPSTASGKQLINARSANLTSVTTTTSTVTVLINRPFLQGRGNATT